MRKDITNVVFDFGGVVAPADLSIVINKFKALGLEDIEKYLNMVRQQGFFGDFETGLIDKEEFRIRVGKEVGREVSMDECRDAYMGFFSTVPERNLELFRKLRAEGYRLSLLSNTNPFIVEWALSKEFDGHGHSLDEYLDSMYLSYELKVMKPDERIYRLMLESEKVAPSQVLFIDDGPKNIAAARQIGINVIQAINGEDWTATLGGYLDIGLIDTMKDLFVNFIGAIVFSVIGFFYVKNRGKGKLANSLIPKVRRKEHAADQVRPMAPAEASCCDTKENGKECVSHENETARHPADHN